MYYLGVDIGGTNVVVGLVDEEIKLIDTVSFKTNAPRSAESICDDIAKASEELAKKNNIDYNEIKAIGVDCPGVISNGVIEFANNIQFNNVPLEAMVSKRMGLPAILVNDGSCAAYGEYIAGSGRGKNSLVMLTIGTGIGGGLVLNNKVFTGATGLGAEMGHFSIAANGRKCSCGSVGCLEAYCSANALIGDTKKAMQKHPESKMWEICPDIEKVSGKTAFRAAEMGDKVAKRVLNNFIKYLSIGVYNIIVLLQPEVVCIGGGMSREGETLLAPIRKYLEKNWLASVIGKHTEIKAAELFGDAGVIGAAACARDL